ncbi:hypothetical protein EIP86_009916 [Pleurotus ostreatoroseus]|nr:hypothetical protein EIP86_009916 [Pleurotus ostreatoroseus]
MFRGGILGLLILVALSAVHAMPAPPPLRTRQSITALSSSQISAFKPYSFFASAGYCQPSATLAWSCGTNCEANPTFKPVASGGDGSSVQFCGYRAGSRSRIDLIPYLTFRHIGYVGYDPALDTVIVSHQGTDPSEIAALLTDGDVSLTNLDSTLFPGISSSVEVHEGFAGEQSKTAQQVLSAVQTALAQNGASHVTMVGHSLATASGAALSLLDSVYLPLHIPGATFKTVLYGLPRVGNQAFANYVDEHLSLTHINNEEDPIPILPGRFLGYVHPSGEVHIEDSGEWASCPGQDNTSTQCIVGDVPNIFDGDESDHDGPYDGVEMGC